MLGSHKIMTFVPTKDHHKARPFYEGVLGLRFISDDQFALALDANGIMVRVSQVPDFKPAPFTILGWEVPDIAKAVSELRERGVSFQRYEGLPQDTLGIWTSPSEAKIAWFKDPEGNVLSLTEFP
jgi:predicted enzyme related to lactoylglutathione lyase